MSDILHFLSKITEYPKRTLCPIPARGALFYAHLVRLTHNDANIQWHSAIVGGAYSPTSNQSTSHTTMTLEFSHIVLIYAVLCCIIAILIRKRAPIIAYAILAASIVMVLGVIVAPYIMGPDIHDTSTSGDTL